MLKEKVVSLSKARVSEEEELNTIDALPSAFLHRAFSGDP